mmetsp:Transcript_21775/g.76445  ORF Transcript_21775/g.76445 Transcript_21775/m.76445 type:complete len:208 (-) Transcript_21775:2370-2993(-)
MAREPPEFSLSSAAAQARAALAVREGSVGADHVSNLQAMRKLALLKRCQGDNDGAAELYARELSILRSVSGDDHVDVAECMRRLGNLYCLRASTRHKARPLLEGALRIQLRAFGEEGDDVADTLDALAVLAAADGDPDGAHTYQERALRVRHTMSEVESRESTPTPRRGPALSREGSDDFPPSDEDDSGSEEEFCEEFKPVVWNVMM